MDTVPVGARIVHPLGVVPETAVDCVQSAGVLELFVFESVSSSTELFLLFDLQKACELGTRYVDLEKEKAKLELDLELTRRDLERVQAELRASGGKFC